MRPTDLPPPGRVGPARSAVKRSWVIERDLIKVRLKCGTYQEAIRPSGHRAVSPDHGTDRWAGLSDAVPAAICSHVRPY